MDDEIKKIQDILGPCIKKQEGLVIGFGKYKGETMGNVASVNLGYIHWMVMQSFIEPKFKAAAKAIIKKEKSKS